MLGISTPSVERVAIQHADTVIKGITDQGTDGVPGDNVLVKDANTLILSLCNVWFEAQRESNLPSAPETGLSRRYLSAARAVSELKLTITI